MNNFAPPERNAVLTKETREKSSFGNQEARKAKSGGFEVPRPFQAAVSWDELTGLRGFFSVGAKISRTKMRSPATEMRSYSKKSGLLCASCANLLRSLHILPNFLRLHSAFVRDKFLDSRLPD